MKTLRHILLRKSLLAIYKVFLSPLIDYGDKIYGKPHNSSFCEKLKSTQYKVALTVTNAKEGTPREKIFQELGLEPLKSRRSFMRFSCMFKLMKNEALNHLISVIPKHNQAFNTRNKYVPVYNCRTDCFNYLFLTCTLNDWFNLNISIRNSESILNFKSKLFSFICLVQNNI